MRLKVYIKLLLIPITLILFTGCQKEASPYSPEKALNTFELQEGFRMELLVAEPLISDPVEIAFDADGRLYVAAMSDYPAEGVLRSSVMLLEDKDGDGRYETGNVFAEDLPFVNGVMPWQNGVLVAFSGDVMMNGARMHNFFDSEWDYGFASGLYAIHNAAAVVRQFNPVLLLPSHGPVITNGAKQLYEYQLKLRNLTALLLRGYDVFTYSSSFQDKVSKPTSVPFVWQISPHLYKFKGPDSFSPLVLFDLINL